MKNLFIKLFTFIINIYSLFYATLFITDYSFIFKSGLTNISGFTGFLSFLLLIRWFLDRETMAQVFIIRALKQLMNLNDKIILFIIFMLIAFTFSAIAIVRHLSLSSSSFDLGIFDQAIWNTLQGDILFSSLKNNINLLGDHFEPILLLIVPFYKLWQNAIVLLLTQAFLLASAVLPLYLIAKQRIKEKTLVYAFIVSYILSRPLRGIAFSDFHPECFIMPILFWSYYFLIKKKNLMFSLSLFFLLLCKEDTTFLVSTFGIFVLFAQKRIKLGLFLVIAGIALWFLETKIIIPYFNPSGNYSYMNRLPLGFTYADNLKAIINNPLLLGKIFWDKLKIEYFIKNFGPVGFLPLFSPAHYILFAIPLLKNYFVNPYYTNFYDITSHYTANLIPFVYIAAIYGAGCLIDKIRYKRITLFISFFIILCSLFFYGKTDAHKFNRFLSTIKNNHTLEKLSYLKMVPKDVSVSTNFNLVPHLSQRKYIFEWNPQAKTAYLTQYLVIDKSLLEYLPQDDTAKIEYYLSEIEKKGYRQIFSNPDKTFLIFYNPDIDKTLVEKYPKI